MVCQGTDHGQVEKEEEYTYSSCGDFYGTRKGLLELTEF